MIAPNTIATEWHHRPKGFIGPCPLCGCNVPEKKLGEHRAVASSEGMNARWIKRRKAGDGWSYTPLGSRKVRTRDNTAPRILTVKGPEERTRDRIIRAARLLADGQTVAGIGKTLGVGRSTIEAWQRRYPEFWHLASDKAVEVRADILRRLAGTDQVLADPAGYLRGVTIADKALAAEGRQLFPSPPDGELNLTTLLENRYLPLRGMDLTPDYIYLLRTVANRWRLVTGDPPLDKIDAALLALFRRFVAACPGLGRNQKASKVTINNYLKTVQRLLDFAAAPARGRRDAMGILDRAPYLRPLREDRPLPKTVPAEYLDAVYAKADIVATPRIPGINPADWWRGLLVLAYNTGLRRRALFNLDWEDVDLDAALVKVPATIIKNKRAIAIPLNAVACLHLARIKRDTGRVFHWPYDKRTFDVTFAKLQWAAGIPAADHFGLHRIRKTAATVLWEDSPAAAQLVMGHTTAAMTIKHYVQAPGIMRAAIERMPQPTAFTGGNGTAGNAGGKADRQTRPKDQGNNDYAI